MNNNIQVEFPKDTRPKYANFVGLQNTAIEFTCDFAMVSLGINIVEVHSRIVMTAFTAKNFLETLQKQIATYENTYGEIVIPGTPDEKKLYGIYPKNDEPTPI